MVSTPVCCTPPSRFTATSESTISSRSAAAAETAKSRATAAISRFMLLLPGLLRPRTSSEPPLPAPVVLDVTEAPATARGDPEVELFHVLVRGELLRGAVHDGAPVLQDVAVVGVAQRDHGVLLGQQEAYPLLPVQTLHDAEDFLDDLRREPHRGLVEQDHRRARHQRAAHGRHL